MVGNYLLLTVLTGVFWCFSKASAGREPSSRIFLVHSSFCFTIKQKHIHWLQQISLTFTSAAQPLFPWYRLILGEAGSSTVCAIGKKTCLAVSSVRIGRLPFTQKPQCTKRLGWVRPDHNSKGGEDIFSTGIFRLEILDYLSSVYFENFRSAEPNLSNHLHSERNWRNVWIFGNLSLVVTRGAAHTVPSHVLC